MSKYKALFIEESREHLAQLSRLLVEIETVDDLAPLVEDVFRRVHSIKGMAASMGYEPIANLAHTMEDLAALWRGATTVDQATVDVLLRGVDALSAQVEAVAGGAHVPEAEDVVAALHAAQSSRASLMEAVVEEPPETASTAETPGDESPGAADESAAEPKKSSATVRVRTDVLDSLIDEVGELFILRERLESLLAGTRRPELRAVLDELSKAIREVHGQVMTVRMTPMRGLTDRYPRLVRDLARSLGKEVELEIEGTDIEIDRGILENLDEPFVHTLRNAVDHGLESPEDRHAAGKPEVGKLSIRASRDRDTVVVVIEDDGRGLDADALREHAIRLGLISEAQAEGLTSRECVFLICLPGFSTKPEVSDVSGRGVGMDAVRARIEALGGTLDIDAALGGGTRFFFRLPLTVAIINVLLVESCRRVFALPVAKVVAVRNAWEDRIREAGGTTYVSFRHALAPVYDLADLLELEPAGEPEHAVIIEDGRDLIAVAVERVVGSHEVVVKPLGDPLDRMDWFSGATVLGDGEPVLILDVPKALRSRRAA